MSRTEPESSHRTPFRTIDTLRTFLGFLEAELPAERAHALRLALEEGDEPFRATVRGKIRGLA